MAVYVEAGSTWNIHIDCLWSARLFLCCIYHELPIRSIYIHTDYMLSRIASRSCIRVGRIIDLQQLHF